MGPEDGSYHREHGPEFSPTLQLLVEVCREVLQDDDIVFMSECQDFEEALNYAFGRLLHEGIDAEVFLAEKGILESPR